MTTRSLHLGLLLAVLSLLLLACEQAKAEEPTAPEYLEGAIQPCTPVGGVEVDPCEPMAFDGVEPYNAYSIPDLGTGGEPYSIRRFLGTEHATGILASHLVIRGTYLPGTVRCAEHDMVRAPTWTTLPDLTTTTTTKCYVDMRVNEYYLGSGPSMLTILLMEMYFGPDRVVAEKWLADVVGREEILFVGPGLDFAVEALEAFHRWDVQRDGASVIAVHPDRDYWLRRDSETHRSSVEIPLADFAAAVTAAHEVRLADYGGRVDDDEDAPMVQTDANKLHDFYVEAGAMDHPDGPPALPPPVR